jgi:hypothetical protein
VEDDDVILEQMDDCDAWGVKFGIREYKFHRDNCFKWAGEFSDVRGSSTVLPIDGSQFCGVRLSFKIHYYGQEDGFIFLNYGHGGSLHTHHPKPNVGDLPFMKQHCSLFTQKLNKDGNTSYFYQEQFSQVLGSKKIKCLCTEVYSKKNSNGS